MRLETVTAVLCDVTLVNGYQHFGRALLPFQDGVSEGSDC